MQSKGIWNKEQFRIVAKHILTVHQGNVPRLLLGRLLREVPQNRNVGPHSLVKDVSRHKRLHADLVPRHGTLE